MSKDKNTGEFNLDDTSIDPFDELNDIEEYNFVAEEEAEAGAALDEGQAEGSFSEENGEFSLDDNDMNSVLDEKKNRKANRKIPVPVIISVSLVILLFFGCVFTIRFAESRKKAADTAQNSVAEGADEIVDYTATVNEEGKLVVNDVIIDDISGEDAKELAAAINSGNGDVIAGIVGTYEIPTKAPVRNNTTTAAPTTDSPSDAKPIKKIAFLGSIIELKCGESKKAYYYFMPSDTTETGITFSSSNSRIATVDHLGNVTGIKPGKTYITITSKVNKDLNDTITVVVSEVPATTAKEIETTKAPETTTKEPETTKAPETTTQAPATIKDITLNDPTGEYDDNKRFSRFVGDSIELDLTISPEGFTYDDLVFTSSNSDICSVDESGKVTCKAVGAAVITVSSKNSSISPLKIVISVSPQL